MTLFFSLLPIFIFGNVHCASMCGPLVMLLAKHRFAPLYFLGRLSSFTLAGLFSAEMGIALFSFFNRYHISALFSLLFGMGILAMAVLLFFQFRIPHIPFFAKKTAHLSAYFGRLMAKNSATATFMFGFCTILLPCGQIVLVFSTIALYADPLLGLVNGFLFALFTSPALICAMKASLLFRNQKFKQQYWMGSATLFIGILAILRGLADLSIIKHLILNPSSPSPFHLALY